MAPSIQALDFGRPSALHVAAEAHGDLDRRRDLPALQPVLQIMRVRDRRRLDEIGRAAQLLEIGAALVGLVAVERGEGQRVDVGGDAEPEDQHQEGRAEQSKAEADGIAHQLERFADRIGEHPPRAEELLSGLSRRAGGNKLGALPGLERKIGPASVRLLEVADERVLERGGMARARRGRPACRSRAPGRHP